MDTHRQKRSTTARRCCASHSRRGSTDASWMPSPARAYAARVTLGDLTLRTEVDGTFALQHRPTARQLQVLMPGYRAARLDLSTRSGLDVALQPNEVRGMYMT